MNLLLVTDIHGDQETLERILERETYDAILCAGDLGDAGAYNDYEANLEEVIQTFDKQGTLVQAVPGNMDEEETCIKTLIDYRINLHKNVASLGDIEAVGFGGGITPFGTPFEPDEDNIVEALDTLHDRMTAEKKIAVVHQPPAATAVDVTDGKHVGSTALRSFVEDHDLALYVTGHIHEGRGLDTLAGTTIVNPGPVQDGYYALATVDDDIEVELKEL